MRRGEVRWAQLGPIVGHEQDGHRPVLIVSDDRYMTARKLAIVFPLTTSDRLKAPLAVELPSFTARRSFALPGQIRTLAVARLGAVLGVVSEREVERCLDAMMHICGRLPARRADNDG
jgi:mRNA interferase MazF